jgi:predicted nucleotidyltransferase component of viral defense system
MKTITTREHDLIVSVRNDALTDLPLGVLEKDLLLTQVLHAVDEVDRDGIGLIFCGGTCVAKAHGLIERMSEDIDFKLVVPEGLSHNARSKQLSQYKKRLANALESLGFLVPPNEIIARDENGYVSLNLHYQSRFPLVASLRSEIKLELNARPPILPTLPLPINSILNALIGAPALGPPIECIGLEETLAEKVLSFLRRTAEARAGRNRVHYDDRLVRHLYDVRAISRARPGLQLPVEYFATLVSGDASQYKNQYPEFQNDSLGQMRVALDLLQGDHNRLEADYLRFVDELVFGDPVSFDEARSTFLAVAEQLLSAIAPR